MSDTKMISCSICGKQIDEQFSNDADPINEGQCCAECDVLIVIPARQKSNDRVTLTREQANFCSAILCQHLMETCQLLGKNQNGSGNPLDDNSRAELTQLSLETQLNLLALGMTSEQIENIVKDFSQAERE